MSEANEGDRLCHRRHLQRVCRGHRHSVELGVLRHNGRRVAPSRIGRGGRRWDPGRWRSRHIGGLLFGAATVVFIQTGVVAVGVDGYYTQLGFGVVIVLSLIGHRRFSGRLTK